MLVQYARAGKKDYSQLDSSFESDQSVSGISRSDSRKSYTYFVDS